MDTVSRETSTPDVPIPGLGDRLYRARRASGGPGKEISQARAGAHVGRSGATVGRWEKGEDLPGLLEGLGLAQLYGVEPGDLIFGPMEGRAAIVAAYTPPPPKPTLGATTAAELEATRVVEASSPPQRKGKRRGRG